MFSYGGSLDIYDVKDETNRDASIAADNAPILYVPYYRLEVREVYKDIDNTIYALEELLIAKGVVLDDLIRVRVIADIVSVYYNLGSKATRKVSNLLIKHYNREYLGNPITIDERAPPKLL
jgi:hypothetical protein